MAPSLQIDLITEAAALSALAPEWSELLGRSTANEPTLSPLWLLAWWRVFGPLGGRALRALALRQGGRLVALLPLLSRWRLHRGAIPLRRLELLGSGEDEADEICSNYIGIVCEAGAEAEVAGALADAIVGGAAGSWDEIGLSAMSGEAPLPPLLCQALGARGQPATVEPRGACPYVPLPASWEAYLKALPSSRRYVITRSQRDFDRFAAGGAEFGRVETAADLPRAREVLYGLHAERWRERGRDGVFGSPRFRAFHEAVLPALLATGALDLFWVAVRGEPVAVLYNLFWNGKVYFYQSGRKTDLPKGLRPGIVLHAEAMRRAIARGAREYDFLAGTSQYKMQLALATRPLVELRATRPSLRRSAAGLVDRGLDAARAVRRMIRSR